MLPVGRGVIQDPIANINPIVFTKGQPAAAPQPLAVDRGVSDEKQSSMSGRQRLAVANASRSWFPTQNAPSTAPASSSSSSSSSSSGTQALAGRVNQARAQEGKEQKKAKP